MLSIRSRMSPRSQDVLPSYSPSNFDKLGKAVPPSKSGKVRTAALVVGVVLGLSVLAAFTGLVSIGSVTASGSGGNVAPPAGFEAAQANIIKDDEPPRRNTRSLVGARDDPEQDPVVVLYTANGLWNSGLWPGWGLGDNVVLNWAAAGVRVSKTCPVKCTFTSDQTQLVNAEMVVMEMVNHVKFLGAQVATDTEVPFPAARPDGIRPLTANFFFEPANIPEFQRYTTGDIASKADLLIAPLANADVPVSSVCPWGRSKEAYLAPPPPKVPGRAVAYFNEHGVAPQHRAFVEQFAKVMGSKFQSFVQFSNTPMPEEAGGHPYSLSKRLDFLGTYKFHFITEFSILDDWVEPEWSQAFLAGTIPIYLGAPNIADYAPGEHSYIAAQDFTSPEDLALYIQAMLEDEERYMSMFDWKQKGLAPRFEAHLDNCFHYAECRICQKAHEKRDADRKARQQPASSGQAQQGVILQEAEISSM